MLIGNYNVFSKSCGFFLGGATISGDRSNWGKTNENLNRFTGGFSQKSSTPSGYVAPHAWVLALKAGGMASFTIIEGTGTVSSGNLAGGLNAVAPLTGSGTISSAALALIVSAVAALTGSGSLSADIIGKLEAAADLAGSGDITAALGALASLVADLDGSGDLDAVLSALATLSADIVVTGDNLTTANVGAAVWAAVAALNNVSGTMGQKLNSAGAAADPLLNAVPGAYAPGTAGYILGTNLDAKISDTDAAVWQRVVESGLTAEEILRVVLAAMAGKTNGSPTNTVNFRSVADDKDRITATLDSDGNRLATTVDGT